MADGVAELSKLYDMLGTVAVKEYGEQIQRVCNEFYHEGELHAKMHIPDNLKVNIEEREINESKYTFRTV